MNPETQVLGGPITDDKVEVFTLEEKHPKRKKGKKEVQKDYSHKQSTSKKKQGKNKQ